MQYYNIWPYICRLASLLLGFITSSINHVQVKGDFVPSHECMVCMAAQIAHFFSKEMNATIIRSSSTLNSNQSAMGCMGNPKAIIRKCVRPSIPDSDF